MTELVKLMGTRMALVSVAIESTEFSMILKFKASLQLILHLGRSFFNQWIIIKKASTTLTSKLALKIILASKRCLKQLSQ